MTNANDFLRAAASRGVRVVREEGLPRTLTCTPPPEWTAPIDIAKRVGVRVREDVERAVGDAGIALGDRALSALEPYDLTFSAEVWDDAATVSALYDRREVDFFRFEGSAWLIGLWLPRDGDWNASYAAFLGYVRDVCAAAHEDLDVRTAWVYTRERRTARGIHVHVIVSCETTQLRGGVNSPSSSEAKIRSANLPEDKGVTVPC